MAFVEVNFYDSLVFLLYLMYSKSNLASATQKMSLKWFHCKLKAVIKRWKDALGII